MINRKDFMKNCVAAVCATGMCSHAKKSAAQVAEDASHSCDPKEFTSVRDKADAARLRFSKLIEILETRLPEDERKQTLHALGGKCADTYKACLLYTSSYYDASRGFMCPARNIRDAIGFADIFPEFLSLWLFNRKILSDEMVVSHLNRIPVMLPRKDCPWPGEGGSVRPIFIGLPQGGKEWSLSLIHIYQHS